MERSEDKEASSSPAAPQFGPPNGSAGPQFGCLASSLVELIETATREFERDREVAKASLVTVSSILQSELKRGSQAHGGRSGALAGWQMLRVRSFIERNLHRNIGVRELSAVAQRSPAHFTRSFKKTFGESPHAYVVRIRLQKACHRMATTSASLAEIALALGFSDQAHFCRLFRQTFRQSPSSWRRLCERQEIDGARVETPDGRPRSGPG